MGVDPQAQLGMILAATSNNLAKAEKQQKKAMKKAKKELKDMFTTKAKELSADVAQYDADLQASVDGLNSTVTSLRSAMAQVPQVPNDPIKWDNADFDKRVVLTARLAALEQEANRFSRKRESDVSRATSQGKAVFDDVGDALSRKVGDLTSLAQKAQASFDNMPAHKSGTASIVSGKVTTLAQVEKDVAAAKLHYPASFAAIETKFAEKFKKMVDQVSDLTGTIKQELDAEEKRELQGMGGVSHKVLGHHLRAHQSSLKAPASVKKPTAAAPTKPLPAAVVPVKKDATQHK